MLTAARFTGETNTTITLVALCDLIPRVFHFDRSICFFREERTYRSTEAYAVK